MGTHISVAKTAVVLGAVSAGWHFCWSTLVALGIAQPFIDFVFWMHFIKPVYVIEPFEISRAAILLLVTIVFGSITGGAFALIWNAAHRS
jgi:hypothetical protein